MKKIVGMGTAAALCFLVLCCTVRAEEIPLIYDDAGLLSEEERTKLEEQAQKKSEEYNQNFVFLTTDDAEGKDARDYADDFYMDHGFYENERSGGIVFLIDMDNRTLQVETAGAMKELFITDSRVENILDAGYPYLTEGDYAECFVSMLDQTAAYIADGVVSGKYVYNEDTGEYRVHRSITPIEMLVSFLMALAAGGAAAGAVIGRYRMKWEKDSYAYQENGKLMLTGKEDHYKGQFVTRRRIPKNNSSGGDSGKTTTHHSSGGGEFGGGGRDF